MGQKRTNLGMCMKCPLQEDYRALPCPWSFKWERQTERQAQDTSVHKRHRLDPWIGKIPWRRELQLTPVFLAGEFHGLRSLVGYRP